MMKIYYNRKVFVVFSIIGVILLLLGAYSYTVTQRLIHTARLLSHSSRVINRAEQVMKLVVEMESGARGFVITGQSDYLEPSNKAIGELPVTMTHLDSLTTDFQSQHEIVKRLNGLVGERVTVTEELIQARLVSLDAAVELLASGVGKQLTNDIKKAIEMLQSEERAFFRSNNTISSGQLREFQWAFVGLALFTSVILMVLFWMINKQLRARVTAEEKLISAIQTVTDLYDHAPCGYHSLNADGVIIEMNQTELEWLGYGHDEIIGKVKFSEIITPESVEVFRKHYLKFKEGGFIKDLEFDMIRKDGSVFPVTLSATAVKNEQGAFVKSRSAVFDNSDRKKLQSERDRFFNHTLDLLVIVDMDGYLLRWNPSWARVLGYADEDLSGKSISDFLHPEDIELTFAVIEERLKKGDPVISFENRYRAQGGSYHWLLWNAVPDVENGLIYGFGRDITERKAAEASVKRLNRELESFSYSVSHDLRAPLRALTGYAQMLKEDCQDKLGDEGNRMTDVIIKSATRMGRLIDDLLEFSRMGRKELSMGPVDVKAMVIEIIGELSAHEHGREITIQLDELPPVYGDRAMLRQVWFNLIANAFKYTRKTETPRIEIGFAENHEGHVYHIKDNGAGFDMKYGSKLFGVFQRLHKMEDFEGTGVGLALVKTIIERHGGKVWADGQLNKGASFYVEMPRTART